MTSPCGCMGAPAGLRDTRARSDTGERVKSHDVEDMKLTAIALASAFALSSTFALANTVRHKPSARTYNLHRGIPLVRSGFLNPNYGNPDGSTSLSAGGSMWNGRSASEEGGGAP